jgi:hypothetical protein
MLGSTIHDSILNNTETPLASPRFELRPQIDEKKFKDYCREVARLCLDVQLSWTNQNPAASNYNFLLLSLSFLIQISLVRISDIYHLEISSRKTSYKISDRQNWCQ